MAVAAVLSLPGPRASRVERACPSRWVLEAPRALPVSPRTSTHSRPREAARAPRADSAVPPAAARVDHQAPGPVGRAWAVLAARAPAPPALAPPTAIRSSREPPARSPAPASAMEMVAAAGTAPAPMRASGGAAQVRVGAVARPISHSPVPPQALPAPWSSGIRPSSPSRSSRPRSVEWLADHSAPSQSSSCSMAMGPVSRATARPPSRCRSRLVL